MTDAEITGEYEKNTGHVIVRSDCSRTTPLRLPVFWWPTMGRSRGEKTLEPRLTMRHSRESMARMAYFTHRHQSGSATGWKRLHDKHYLRKHGKNAYYGQSKDK
jgi:L-ribulose-5-phosphate 4-epimerase